MDNTEAVLISSTSSGNLSFTKQVTAKAADDGEVVVLVDLSANYNQSGMMGGGPSISYNVNISNVGVAEANKALVQTEVDNFVAEVKLKVGSSMPVIIQ